MAFRPIYTLYGGVPPVRGYGITAAQAWDRGAVVALDASGTLIEPADDSSDVLGVALGSVTGGESDGPQTDVALVTPFIEGVVYAVVDASGTDTSPAVTDIGTGADLDISGGVWGILFGTAATASTPQFKIIDIDTVRAEWHVVIDVAGVADVYQWYDATV